MLKQAVPSAVNRELSEPQKSFTGLTVSHPSHATVESFSGSATVPMRQTQGFLAGLSGPSGCFLISTNRVSRQSMTLSPFLTAPLPEQSLVHGASRKSVQPCQPLSLLLLEADNPAEVAAWSETGSMGPMAGWRRGVAGSRTDRIYLKR